MVEPPADTVREDTEETARRGRPPVGPVVDVALWPYLLDEIDMAAERTGTARAALMRDALALVDWETFGA